MIIMDTFVDERDCKLLEADGIRIKKNMHNRKDRRR